ncbi:hypothetical protein Unana1_08078 [Umbelopsis nana]
MSKLTNATTHNSTFFKEHRPVALVVGATAGIGQSIAYKIASYSTDPYIVIVGRNEQRGQETLEELKRLNSSGTYVFEKCDMTVLDEIRDLVKRVTASQPTFNLLSISSGGLNLKERINTVDGLDERLTINFFSRFTLIKLLLPYLNAAAKDGQYVSVLSVLAAAKGSTFKLDDLGLDNGYSFSLAISQSAVLNDLTVEELSTRNPNIAFYHAYPGWVKTDILASMPWYIRYPAKLGQIFGVTAGESADYLLYGITKAKESTGWALLGADGEQIKPTKLQTAEGREKVWEYATNVTKTADESS